MVIDTRPTSRLVNILLLPLWDAAQELKMVRLVPLWPRLGKKSLFTLVNQIPFLQPVTFLFTLVSYDPLSVKKFFLPSLFVQPKK